TFRADIKAIRRAITPNSILLVGSAPSYAHGVVDPIEEMGAIAQKEGLLLHVDACIGGFQLPFFARLGATVPIFDFRVPGVTSISMDLHKYAYAAKGASLVLYRDSELRRHQIFSCSHWSGYSVVNNTLQGSKTGGAVAAAWAVVNYLGEEGYLKLTKLVLDATNHIVTAVNSMEDLEVMGRPDMSLVAISSSTIDIFRLADELTRRGWFIQAQLSFATSRENLHLTVTPGNAPCAAELVDDLRECIQIIKEQPSPPLPAALIQGLTTIDPDQLGPSAFSSILAMAGIEGTDLPEDRAMVNNLLNALPPSVREPLLAEFFNQLFVSPNGDQ
ncbi:MAG: aspartate aminotransferase family protein, partial [Proteobacteria bacterium]|nr:aspartate aminotransferase family protein [Pseudomonadota bacterium]